MHQQNELCRLATPLITLITQIRHTQSHQHVDKLRAKIIADIQTFQTAALQAGYPQKTVLMTRYCLCTTFDEAVLKQPWGQNSCWSEQTLLSHFHKETWGGERFYIILDHMAKQPREHNDFLEFAYTLLSLGFEGKFYGPSLSLREEVRNRIFYKIRNARPKPDRELCQQWQDTAVLSSNKQQSVKLKRFGVLSLGCLGICIFTFNILASMHTSKTLQQLSSIGNQPPVTTFLSVKNHNSHS